MTKPAQHLRFQRPSGKGWHCTFAAAVFLTVMAMLAETSSIAAARAEVDPETPKPPLAEITVIREKALALLAGLRPDAAHPPTPYAHAPDQPTCFIKGEASMIRWGNLFAPGETAALVTIESRPQPEDNPDDQPPQWLCFFVWKGRRWEFRQFLGNARGLSVHHRRDRPAAFLQGWYKTARNEGVHLSWYYDPRRGKLVSTGFEKWGPFHLAGDYLILESGFQRLAHDWEYQIHSYKNGRKGPLLAALYESDSGRFTLECPSKAPGLWELWRFGRTEGGGTRQTVSLTTGPQAQLSEGNPDSPNARGEIDTDSVAPEEFLNFMTGLNPALADGEWKEDLPRRPRGERLKGNVTGDPLIVKRLTARPRQAN